MRQLNTAGSPVKFTKPILPPADLLPQISETSATGWFSWFDFTINFVTVKTIFAGVQIHCDVNQRIVFTSIPIEAIFFLKIMTVAANTLICHVCGQNICEQYHSKVCKNPINNIQCEICHTSFKRFQYLRIHYRLHLEGPQYECKICFVKLTTKQNLKYHIKFVHSKIKDKVCSICDSTFATTSHLRRHQKIHTEKLYHCDSCQKSFHFKYNKDVHVQNCSKGL